MKTTDDRPPNAVRNRVWGSRVAHQWVYQILLWSAPTGLSPKTLSWAAGCVLYPLSFFDFKLFFVHGREALRSVDILGIPVFGRGAFSDCFESHNSNNT